MLDSDFRLKKMLGCEFKLKKGGGLVGSKFELKKAVGSEFKLKKVWARNSDLGVQ